MTHDLKLPQPPEESAPLDRSPLDQSTPPKTSARFPLGIPPLGRGWLYGLGAVTLVGIGVWSLRPSPKRVDLITVPAGSLEVTVEAEGRTRVRDRFIVSAPVDGRLSRIDLAVGDRVTANEQIAQIDPLPLNSAVQASQARIQELQAQIRGVETLRPKAAALQQAQSRITAAQAEQKRVEAAVASAAARLQQARHDRDRATDLATQGAISEQAREAAQLSFTAREQEHKAAQQELQSAIAAMAEAQQSLALLRAEQQDPDYLLSAYRAEIAQTEAELDRLADEARRTAITAPTTGQVLRILEESARYVTAGSPLLELGDPHQLEIVIDVLSRDAVKIEPGDRIYIDQWGGDDRLGAAVTTVEPSAFTKISALGVEEQRVNVIAHFTDPEVPLGDNYRVDSQIVIDAIAEAPIVPLSALFPCASETCVFVVKQNRAQQTPVQIGLRNTFDAAVAAGLKAGETVIAYPETVAAGDRVQPR